MFKNTMTRRTVAMVIDVEFCMVCLPRYGLIVVDCDRGVRGVSWVSSVSEVSKVSELASWPGGSGWIVDGSRNGQRNALNAL